MKFWPDWPTNLTCWHFFSFLNRQICLIKGTNFFHVIEIKVKIMILQCKSILIFLYMSFLMWKIWSKLSIRTGLLNAFTFIFQILGLKYIFTNDWNEYLWISFGFNFRGFTLVYSHNLREIQHHMVQSHEEGYWPKIGSLFSPNIKGSCDQIK